MHSCLSGAETLCIRMFSEVLLADKSSASILNDCSRDLDHPELRTEVRGRWTDIHLYILFGCPESSEF